jgi:hypothetical protein
MFTATDKLKCVLRELRMRQKVYPRRIRAGYMHQSTADHEIELMREIVDDYQQQAERERLL